MLVKSFKDILDCTVIFYTVNVSQNFAFCFLFVSDSSKSDQAVKFYSLTNLPEQGKAFEFKSVSLYVKTPS